MLRASVIDMLFKKSVILHREDVSGRFEKAMEYRSRKWRSIFSRTHEYKKDGCLHIFDVPQTCWSCNFMNYVNVPSEHLPILFISVVNVSSSNVIIENLNFLYMQYLSFIFHSDVIESLYLSKYDLIVYMVFVYYPIQY